MIPKNLSQYSKLFTEYTELRLQENRELGIAMVKGNIVRNAKAAISGVSARIYQNGFWGFSSNPDFSDEKIKQTIKSARDNAVFLNSKEKINKGKLPEGNAVSENDFSTKKQKKSQKDLIEFVKEIDNHIVKKYPKLCSRTIALNCLDMEKSFINSDGSLSYSIIPRAMFYIILSIEKDGEPIELTDVYGGFGEFEDNFSQPNLLFEKINRQYEDLLKKKEGVCPKAGIKDCILDAELSGILAHEAIGHTVEADYVLGGSIAGEYLKKQVASPLITLTDFANTAFGKLCPVPVFVDDEGVKAEDAKIIEKGILKSFLHNKETAKHFNMKLTGNARAFQFSDEPIIRMRNTAILPGKDELEKMIFSIDDGYYLIKYNNGEADLTGEFMFGITLGYEIKNGKLGKALKDTTISGIAFDVLKSVSMISDEMKWNCSGMCGKKQWIPVSEGGPAIKCKVNVGGK
jgi:TldD protein